MPSKQITPVQAFSKDLALRETAFKSVLPAHISPKKFMRTVIGAVQNNPDILKCDHGSIFAACQKAAQDGLILDNREAALVSFGKVCTYMPMVAGILKKMRNSGQVSTVTAQVVCENDHFAYNPAQDDVPSHSPDWFGDRGKMIGVYAVARLKDGNPVVEIMNMNQIEAVRKVSRAKDGPAWKNWGDEMARKSVLRRLAKFLPSSADLDQVFDHDNESFDLGGEDITDVQPEPVKKKANGKTRAAAKIAEASQDVDDVDPETGEVLPQVPDNDGPDFDGDPGPGEQDLI